MQQKEGRLLRIEEVAMSVGVSVKTINNWYWFRMAHPEHKLAKLLPDYIQDGIRQTRFWKQSDIWKLLEFKTKLPKGRNGILGDITQKHYRRKKEREKANESE